MAGACRIISGEPMMSARAALDRRPETGRQVAGSSGRLRSPGVAGCRLDTPTRAAQRQPKEAAAVAEAEAKSIVIKGGESGGGGGGGEMEFVSATWPTGRPNRPITRRKGAHASGRASAEWGAHLSWR